MDEFDLGSAPENEDLELGENDDTKTGFDPFANASDDETTAPAATAGATKASGKSEPALDLSKKPPVFDYAGATEEITDDSKTFEELRIEKSSDFPELEDGKKVSWAVEYGKITKTVADPKGTSIGKMKADIEKSKEFEDSLKKRGADKNPTCKIKPRVTAQSKGTKIASYRGVFSCLDEVEAAGKVISIIPGKDGKVYEIRKTALGRFTTPIVSCDLLDDVVPGFVPAPGIPRIPMDMMVQIITFFRSYVHGGSEIEVLVNIYWDKESKQFMSDVPEQTVSKASVDSVENLDFAHDRYIHYMDVHSHNSMKAFFSLIDDADEKATRLYTVIGCLDSYFPVVKTRICNGGKFLEIDPAEVFEHVALTFPDKWKDNVHLHESHDGEAKWPTVGDDL